MIPIVTLEFVQATDLERGFVLETPEHGWCPVLSLVRGGHFNIDRAIAYARGMDDDDCDRVFWDQDAAFRFLYEGRDGYTGQDFGGDSVVVVYGLPGTADEDGMRLYAHCYREWDPVRVLVDQEGKSPWDEPGEPISVALQGSH